MAQHMHRIGADLNAGADLGKRGRLFENLNMVAGLHQTRSR
jgi:hypothetical protein